MLLPIKRWLYQIFTHNYAEQLRINRAIQRKAVGVDQQDHPYPGAVADSNNPTTNTTINHLSGGWIKGILLGAALLGGGIAGTMSLLPSGKPTAPPTSEPARTGASVATPAPTPAIAAETPAAVEYQAVYEQRQPDGSWKVIKVEKLPR
jgi:hypothetical protein